MQFLSHRLSSFFSKCKIVMTLEYCLLQHYNDKKICVYLMSYLACEFVFSDAASEKFCLGSAAFFFLQVNKFTLYIFIAHIILA